MRTYVIVLARHPAEAITYARRVELQRGRWRYATRAASLRGLRSADVHELPSFATRPDKHAVNAALRFVRGNRIQVEMPPSPAGRLDLEQALIEAYRLDLEAALAEAYPDETSNTLEAEPEEDPDGEEAGEAEPSEDAAPASPRQRRSRCKVCNELTAEPHDHASAEVPAPEPTTIGGFF